MALSFLAFMLFFLESFFFCDSVSFNLCRLLCGLFRLLGFLLLALSFKVCCFGSFGLFLLPLDTLSLGDSS